MPDERDDETRRFADIHLQIQIPVLAQRITALEETIRDKFSNGINHEFEKIHDRLNELQCGVHTERMTTMKENLDTKINSVKQKVWWLFGIISALFIALIIDYLRR